MSLGEKIKETRKKTGLSQEQLSEKLGISRSAVAKWETDKGFPDVDNLKALSRLFGVSIDYLLNNDESLEKPATRQPTDLSTSEDGSDRKRKNKAVCEKYLLLTAVFLQ